MTMQERMNDISLIREGRPDPSARDGDRRSQIDLRIGGMDCPHCTFNVEEALRANRRLASISRTDRRTSFTIRRTSKFLTSSKPSAPQATAQGPR
jgi:hypothetical protein